MKVEVLVMRLRGKPRTGSDPPKSEEAKKGLTRSPGRLCQHLGFGLLAFRTMGQSISVVLKHTVCGHFSQQPLETSTETRFSE